METSVYTKTTFEEIAPDGRTLTVEVENCSDCTPCAGLRIEGKHQDSFDLDDVRILIKQFKAAEKLLKEASE